MANELAPAAAWEGGGRGAEETAMATGTRSILSALMACLVAGALGGCDQGDQLAGAPATTQSAATQSVAGGAGAGAGARDDCPTEAQIAAVIGTSVKRLKGAGCSYESEDANTHVSILIMRAANGEQLLKEMRESAAERPNAKVEFVAGVGDWAHMYGTTGMATAVAVGGGKAYWVDISSVGGANVDRKPQVLEILRLLMR